MNNIKNKNVSKFKFNEKKEFKIGLHKAIVTKTWYRGPKLRMHDNSITSISI